MAEPQKTTVISTKGQVVLPANVRLNRNWRPGTRLIVEETADGVLLRSEPRIRPSTLDEVIGCLKYDGPPISVEEMDEAVSAYFRREHGRDDRD